MLAAVVADLVLFRRGGVAPPNDGQAVPRYGQCAMSNLKDCRAMRWRTASPSRTAGCS